MTSATSAGGGASTPGADIRPVQPNELSVAARVSAEKLKMLIDRNVTPAVGAIPYSLAVAAFVWGAVPHQVVVAWGLFKCATISVRLAATYAHARRPSALSTAGWERLQILAMCADGVGYSLQPILFSAPTQPIFEVAMLACLVGVTAIGAVVLSSHAAGAIAFIVVSVAPAALAQLVGGTRIGVYGAVVLAIYCAILIDHALRAARQTDELLRLRFEIAAARDAALAGEQAKSRFLAAMSHELRTPLNAVIGMTTLLAEDHSPEARRERIEIIRSGGEALLDLIDNLLDLSKAEAGRLELERRTVDLLAVVDECIEGVMLPASDKGLALSCEIADDCPETISTNAVRLRQVLINLLANAIKFTPSGRVELKVWSEAARLGRATICFEVSDTGSGIPAERLTRLFQPFEQLGRTASESRGGVGLGLWISREIAIALGGTITVRSEPGHGSSFRLTVDGGSAPPAPEHARVGRALIVGDAHADGRVAGLLRRVGLEARPVRAADGADVVAGYEWLEEDLSCQLVIIDIADPTRALAAEG